MKAEDLLIEVLSGLAALDIKVTKDGRIRKEDIRRAIAVPLEINHLEDLAKGTDFEDFSKDPELKKVVMEHASMLEKMPDEQVKRLFGGDYHIGYESHSFDDPSGVKDFMKDVGPILGWDPESYSESEDDEDEDEL